MPKKCFFYLCENSAVAHIEYGNDKCGSNLRFYCAEHYDFLVKYWVEAAQDDPELNSVYAKLLKRNKLR